MRRISRLPATLAGLLAITSFDLAAFASAAHAGKSHSAPSRSSSTSSKPQRVHTSVHRVQPRFIQRQHMVKQPVVFKQPVNTLKAQPFVAKKFAASPFAQQILVRRNLPFLKPTANAGPLKARVALPLNLQPKLTLVKPPNVALGPKFAPFVQRHWKKAFFWVAVAGIGYLTIPEYYYDRWAAYVDEDDYESAADLLALAALDDDDEIVRVQKPDTVAYRYQATVGPTKVSAPGETTEPAAPTAVTANASCSLGPFVDRQWSQPFSWVQVPDVGNVTVPDQSYDRFVSFVGSEPPNYRTACTVLAEAAAADTVSPAEASTSTATSTN